MLAWGLAEEWVVLTAACSGLETQGGKAQPCLAAGNQTLHREGTDTRELDCAEVTEGPQSGYNALQIIS